MDFTFGIKLTYADSAYLRVAQIDPIQSIQSSKMSKRIIRDR